MLLTEEQKQKALVILEDRKVSDAMVKAFLSNQKKKIKNTHTDGKGLYLHGNLIARHTPDGGIEGTLAGWPGPTTKSRLNTLARHVGSPSIGTKKGKHYLGDKEIGSNEFFTMRPGLTKKD